MTRREWLPHLGAVLAYVCIAVAFSWPLVLHLPTHVTGDPGGDTGVYVWNQWLFQHEARVVQRNPLSTDRIFSTTGRPVDLTQHNYTLFSNVLALPFIEWLGVVPTFNLVYLATVVITAWMGFVLCRQVTGGATLESWLAGLAFAWSPVLVARSTGHFSLVAAAPLAAFLWSLFRLDRSGRVSDSAIAGASVAWAAACDPYYAVFCVDIAFLFAVSRLWRCRWQPGSRRAPGVWLVDLGIFLLVGLVVGLALGQGGRFEVFGLPVSVRGLYAPVFALSLLVTARVLIYLSPTLTSAGLPSPRAVWLTAMAGVTGAVLMSPTLYGAARRIVDGTWVSPPVYWRSSPAGVDLLAFLTPNPSHPLVRWLLADEQATRPTVFIEYTVALGTVMLVVIAVAVWRARLRAGAWFWLFAAFTALALGPYVHVAGINTYVPGPWALLRYVPIVNLTRMPGRFAVVAALAASVLFALALTALGTQWPQQRRRVLGVVAVLLLFELLPVPRQLYSAHIPSIYETVRADPRPVRVLELPFGVRDGVTSEGNFSARYQFNQTRHGKSLIGGYLSRVSGRRVRELKSEPFLRGLMTLSAGADLPPAELKTVAAAAPAFLTGAEVGWVVMHPALMSSTFETFARDDLDLERVAEDDGAVLYRRRPQARAPAPPRP